MSHTHLIITIDGPAGSGKSTIAALLARRLDIAYLDTGAMYRAVTLAALERNTPLDDPDALAQLTKSLHIEFRHQANDNLVLLDGRDVSQSIRDPAVTAQAHKIAKLPQVRHLLVDQQRRIAGQLGSLVTEGRDQGSVVFPDTPLKFYLDADPAVRARRRWLQLQQQGRDVSYEQTLNDQIARDARDANRTASPMKVPEQAITIDTAEMTIEQVVDKLHAYITDESHQTAN